MKQTTNLYLTLALLLVGSMSFAQSQIGVRFYQGFQKQSIESQYLVSGGNGVEYDLNYAGVSNSQTVGIFTQFEFGFLYIQPEFLYTAYSTQFNAIHYMSEGSEEITINERFQQFDLPINAGVKYKGFRIGGGPIFHMIQDIETGFRGLSSIEVAPKKLSAGFQGSIGYDWKIFHFDLRYQKDFNSVTDHLRFHSNVIKSKSTPSSIQVGVAVGLGNK